MVHKQLDNRTSDAKEVPLDLRTNVRVDCDQDLMKCVGDGKVDPSSIT